MTFDEWCSSKQINGNWREALFRSLAAEYGENDIPEDQDVWAKAWKKLLDRIYSPATGCFKVLDSSKLF